ncbi:MAG: septum formation inhibitor Maf [Kineosporiaceae bacterium]|nr:septum formation inhibitor Maf [Kineosporiaceae bacterium]
MPRTVTDATLEASDAPARPIRLVLASASPARLRTLRAAGLDPEVVVSAVDEDDVVARYGVTEAEDVVLVLARAKAEDVAGSLAAADGSSTLVLGCDSMLDLDGEVMGKPTDPDDARRRWQRMRGRSGVLHTGHWLLDTARGGGCVGSVAATTVHFADLSDAEIEAYVASGEPLAVAGAFTIDGLGAAFVRAIDGDHHNVVGVSVPLLRELARDLGVDWPRLWRHAPSPKAVGG